MIETCKDCKYSNIDFFTGEVYCNKKKQIIRNPFFLINCGFKPKRVKTTNYSTNELEYTEKHFGHIRKIIFRKKYKCTYCGHKTHIVYYFNLNYQLEIELCPQCLIERLAVKRRYSW